LILPASTNIIIFGRFWRRRCRKEGVYKDPGFFLV
jgi:hypothetical protein